MTKKAQVLLLQALKLSPKERVKIANDLWDSVDPPLKLSPEWQEEIERRVENIVSGKTKGIPLSKAMAKLRREQAKDQRARGQTNPR